MKQITMQEAMRAVADGKFVSVIGGDGELKDTLDPSEGKHYFDERFTYCIKETVKVAVFRHISGISEGYTLLLFESEYKPSPNIAQVSDWVEIEVTK